MFNYFKRRAEALRQAGFNKGYDWAAGTLLLAHRHGELNEVRLRLAVCADNRFDRTTSDDGVEAAMNDFATLCPLSPT